MAAIVLPTFTEIEFTDLIANGPAIINNNFSAITSASDSAAGVTQIASQVEVDAGTEAFKYVTPNTLNTFVNRISGNLIASFPVSASQVEVDAGVINNKFVVPNTLNGYITTLSANTTEADEKLINNKFITPAVFNTVRNSEYIFSKNYTDSRTFNYSASVQEFNLSANISFYAIVCIAGGSGGYNTTGSSSIDGGASYVNAESDLFSVSTAYAPYYALNSGCYGGAGTLGGNAGYGSISPVVGGIGMIPYYNGNTYTSGWNTTKTYQFSQYISITSCLGGNASGSQPTTPGYGAHATYGGGGGGTTLTFVVYKNNTLFIDHALIAASVRNTFIPKFYISDSKLYIHVGKGGTSISPVTTNGVDGQVIIYWWV